MGIIVGTAGHIDHGKSSLVKYLTGTDPDRLKEEKERGITIELGYAFLPLPGGGKLAFIDVPGHEKFIRQMVSGVASVDFFMLVVAADEGVMPQTREHVDILRLLDVKMGLVALTKCDLVDSEMQDIAELDIKELLHENSFDDLPVIRVSSFTGIGMDDLRNELLNLAVSAGVRPGGDRFRMDVDRIFILKGFGAIIAGTGLSGRISVGDKVELLPRDKIFRIREMSVNDDRKAVEGGVGDRIALNLVGLERDDVYHGSSVAEPGYLTVRNSLDSTFSLLPSSPPLRRNQRVRLHTGTAEVMARAVPVQSDIVSPGTTDFVHFQLESPVVAMTGDKLVVRSYSPIVTIGGGTILEMGTRKVRKKYADDRYTHLEILASGDTETVVEDMIIRAGIQGVSEAEVIGETGYSSEEVLQTFTDLSQRDVAVIIKDGTTSRLVDSSDVRTSEDKVVSHLSQHHSKNPVSPGVPLSSPGRILSGYPQWFIRSVIDRLMEAGKIQRRGDWFALPDHSDKVPAGYSHKVDELMKSVEIQGNTGCDLQNAGDPLLIKALIERAMLLELKAGTLITAAMADTVFRKAEAAFGEDGFTLSEFRDFLGVSRKVALLWGELFDRTGWTVRRDDRRFFSRR